MKSLREIWKKNVSSSHCENSGCVRRDYVADSVVMLLMVRVGMLVMLMGLNIKGTSLAHVFEMVGDVR